MKDLMSITGRDKYFAARARELKTLIDPRTGMLRHSYARSVRCPFCSSNKHARLFIKNGFTFVRCAACGLMFANPQVKDSVVLRSYRRGGSNDLWIDVLTNPVQLKLDTQKFNELLDHIDRLHPKKGKLLDIGCSIGLFMKLAKDRGWDVHGLELSKRAVAYARRVMKVPVTETLLYEAGFKPASFDVVTCLALLEHLNDPMDLLTQVRSILRPGGILVVITPNASSLACRILHGEAATFDGRNHLVYFTPATLSKALAKAGFRVRDLSAHITSTGPVMNWLRYDEPYGTGESKGDPLTERLDTFFKTPGFRKLFSRLRLGYKMHCFAQKKRG